MKRFLFALSMMAFAFGYQAHAQVSITSIATPYTQNFDALSNDTSSTPHAMTLTGWQIYEKGAGAAADQMYKGNYGTKNTGDTYSYGDTVSTERALGSIASVNNQPSYGVIFQNNTGATITDLNITFREEQWRVGDTISNVDSTIFEYSTTATGINDTTAAWNPVSSLMMNSLVTATAGALNGNLSANSANKTGTISVLILNGNKIALRWRDVNMGGSDDGLAIDDLSITFASSGNPKPSIVSLTPPDNATTVSAATTTSISMTFDQNVTVGTGNIYLKNLTDATQQTIACASTTVSGAAVTIPGVALLDGKQYAVQFDSTCYTSSSAANSYGIYDNTSWNFETKPNSVFDYTKNNLSLAMVGNNLEFTVANSNNFSMRLFDINGKLVNQQDIHAVSGENQIDLSQQHIVKGIYLIQLSNKDYQGVLKFVKQ
jgi:hypothetical protein